jgi:phospholipase C
VQGASHAVSPSRRTLLSIESGWKYIMTAKPRTKVFPETADVPELTSIKMVGVNFAVFAALCSLAVASPSNIAYKGDWRTKIKNVVVLCEENRSFDTFAGGLSYNPSINGLLHHNYCNSM